MSGQELPKSYSPQEVETKWYKFWEDLRFFSASARSSKHPYCIVLPPPNVTGALHMGHALVDTVQDALIRWKRMSGFEALWIPGVDHAGIATQTVVEKHLIATTGKRRKDFSREEFLAHVWSWKDHYEKNIIQQLKKVGCSCDWEKGRFTMDEGSNQAVKTMFKKMYDEGLIYKGDYLVNWDPLTQTALADDEVEHEEKDGFLYHIRYRLENSLESIIVATTRPETLLGDVAVAVNEKDPRYQHALGQHVLLPLVGRKIPVIKDHYVDPAFGTGAVKITPAHDFNDYEIGSRHGLPMINIMTPDGRINENGGEFQGLSMTEAREAVCKKLEEQGLLVKKEPHAHRVGVSYRSKAVIEPYLSKQWFIKMHVFKKPLLDAIAKKKIKMVPEHWESTYYHWIEHLKDWCISRQLWWGHQIPIWYNIEDPSIMICYDGEGLPPEVEQNPSQWRQDEDVLDTWFSSGLWPFSTMGWPEDTDLLKKFYPTSVLITGHDILFFWVARMILMGEYALGSVPFHETFLHGLIYGKSYLKHHKDGSFSYLSATEKLEYDLGKPLPKDISSKWEKMSKTKGNVIDPLEIIELYGADAMRMALLSSLTHARQIDLDRRRFEEFKNFANKMWNSARFVFMNLEASPNGLKELSSEALSQGLDLSTCNLEDFWILNQLQHTIREGIQHLESYEFDKVSALFYAFFWDKFCAYYLEIVKPVLFGKAGDERKRQNKQIILVIVLLASLRLMHPLAPFITEEIFQRLKNLFGDCKARTTIDPYTQQTLLALESPACILAPYPEVLPLIFEESVAADFALLESIVYQIRNIRGQMQMPPQVPCDIYFVSSSSSTLKTLLENNQLLITALVKVGQMIFTSSLPDHLGFATSTSLQDIEMVIPLPSELKEKEKQRLLSLQEKLELQKADLEKKLNNQDFVEKAPSQLVDKLRLQLQECLEKTSDLNNKLKAL
jgi:valyl-tRNA synthetase